MKSSILFFVLFNILCSTVLTQDFSAQADLDHESVVTYVMENLNQDGEFEMNENEPESFENLVSAVKKMAYNFLNSNDDVEHTANLEGKGNIDISVSMTLDNKTRGDVSLKASGSDSLNAGVARHGRESQAWAHGSRNATSTIKTPNGTLEVQTENRYDGRIRVERLRGREAMKSLREFPAHDMMNCGGGSSTPRPRFPFHDRDSRGRPGHRNHFPVQQQDKGRCGGHVHLVRIEGRSFQLTTVGNSTIKQLKSLHGSAHVLSAKGKPTRIAARFDSRKHVHAEHNGKKFSSVASTRGNHLTTVRLA